MLLGIVLYATDALAHVQVLLPVERDGKILRGGVCQKELP